MAGYKETPRQKMIGMMYLVLTALLALNVSVEILNAFLVVNESMETTNRTFNSKIEDYYQAFENQYKNEPNKVAPYWEKAQQAQKLADEIKDYLINIKYESIAFSEKIPIDSAKVRPLYRIATKDKYDETTVYFIGNSQDGSKGKAGEMKQKLAKYKQDLMNLVEPGDKENYRIAIDLDGPFYDADHKEQNWEMHNFYHTILAADVTILNKLIAEVQNAELDIITYLRSKVGATDFKIDQVGATVVPKSQYVFMGENYEAEVFVTAMDSKQNFTANIGGRGYMSKEGKVEIQLPATTPGPKHVEGSVMYKSPSGEVKPYKVEFDYIVAPPTLSVSLTKMNVFYVGVDNPVSISAGGVSDDQIIATINNGTITRSGDGWIVKPTTQGNASIEVNAKLTNRIKFIGKIPFRVKTLPLPVASIANTSSGTVIKEVLLASSIIIPKWPDDFEFKMNFPIVSFKMSGNKKGGDYLEFRANGNKLTQEMLDFIKNSRAGNKIMFEDIIAKSPEGKNRPLNPIVLTIQ